MFFCCEICARQLKGLVARVRSATGWPMIDTLEIEGDRRGRTFVARHGTSELRGSVTFDPEGSVLWFRTEPV
jgi:hypothetical protein